MSFSSEEDEIIVGFGTNYFHALGGTEKTSLSLPQHESDSGHEDTTVPARLLEDAPWKKKEDDTLKQIACSANSTIFLTEQGRVYQTGTLHGKVWASPVRVEVAYPRKCVEISAGRHFWIGRLERGIGVVSCGAGHFGQLGLGNHVSSLQNPQIIPHLLPQALGTARVQQVAAGAWHALALLDNGTCMAWGSNRKLQCGVKSPQKKSPPTIVFPQPIEFYGTFQKVAAGRLHSMALEKDTGRVYMWGGSHHGECGQYSRKTSVAPPRLVEALQRVVVVDIAAGDTHSLALTGGGRVFVWGNGMDGQLGLGGAIPISRPKLLADLDFVAIEAGREWKRKQIMPEEPVFRDFTSSPIPTDDASKPPPPSYTESPATRPSHLSSVPKIVQIKAAGAYSVAVSSSGHLYSWGYNDGGQLGVPRSLIELPLVEVTSSMMKQSSSGRLLDVRTFDSKHNVLLPRRIDALGNYRIKSVAVGPCNMWCVGTKRPENETEVVGQTLYEVQEERRRKALWRMRQHLSSSASASSTSDKMSPTIMSIRAVSEETVEEITIPNNVFTHAESTGMDEDGASTSTYESEARQAGIILPVAGEHQSPKMAPRIQETTPLGSPQSGESLTVTSVESPPPDEKASPSTPTRSSYKQEDSQALSGSPERDLGAVKSLAKLIGKRSKSRKEKSQLSQKSEDLPEVVNGLPFSTGTTSPLVASAASPLGFAGGRPHFSTSTNRRFAGRSQSVPSRRSTTPPPDSDGQASPMASPERRGIAGSMSVARLMRGRRNPKTPKEKTAKKGRVRKALNVAFGGKER